ncbi:MAG: hypothetical protein P4L50_00265 [Anaerolineaceae bacterium]|nr:hypothetical protein [Anaerolineaceae bacterium]
MARWKLMTSHYLNTVRPAKWRYSAIDQASGELLEKEFLVPRMLDINDPKCWTNRAEVGNPVSAGGHTADVGGEIVVCHQGKGLRTDIEFIGDPTPDMVPLDEEAQTISDSFEAHWAYKPDQPEMSYSQLVVDRSYKVSSAPQPVEVKGLDGLVAAMEVQSRLINDLISAQSSQRRI